MKDLLYFIHPVWQTIKAQSHTSQYPHFAGEYTKGVIEPWGRVRATPLYGYVPLFSVWFSDLLVNRKRVYKLLSLFPLVWDMV